MGEFTAEFFSSDGFAISRGGDVVHIIPVYNGDPTPSMVEEQAFLDITNLVYCCIHASSIANPRLDFLTECHGNLTTIIEALNRSRDEMISDLVEIQSETTTAID